MIVGTPDVDGVVAYRRRVHGPFSFETPSFSASRYIDSVKMVIAGTPDVDGVVAYRRRINSQSILSSWSLSTTGCGDTKVTVVIIGINSVVPSGCPSASQRLGVYHSQDTRSPTERHRLVSAIVVEAGCLPSSSPAGVQAHTMSSDIEFVVVGGQPQAMSLPEAHQR